MVTSSVMMNFSNYGASPGFHHRGSAMNCQRFVRRGVAFSSTAVNHRDWPEETLPVMAP